MHKETATLQENSLVMHVSAKGFYEETRAYITEMNELEL